MTSSAGKITAIIDACVLASGLRRRLTLSLADVELYNFRWSTRILNETQRAIHKIVKSKEESLKQCTRIQDTFPNAFVSEFENIENELILPDPDDRHVLATALKVNAQYIVTDNLKDFPRSALAPHSVEAVSCDQFVANIIRIHPETAMDAIRLMREKLNKPALSKTEFIQYVGECGLPQTEAALEANKHLL